MKRTGVVYLVGAGPGDPDLLTVKAQRLLRAADVVVYDRLVSAEILALIPTGVARIAVGKEPGCHTANQTEINRLLAALAHRGRCVVRLKGGDPLVFGRGGEEALYLSRAGVSFEIVPGVTAATACAAYAGIPLTHRGLATGVQLVTGHRRDDASLDLDWQRLANPDSTIAVYMGLANLERICRELAAAGLPADTPAAAIENGTTAHQRRCLATLSELPAAAAAMALASPVLLIIGKVVGLAQELDWFEREGASAEQAHGGG